MKPDLARIVAAFGLLVGSAIILTFAVAVILARSLVAAGAPVSPADAAVLGDVVAVLPFLFGFAGLGLLGAIGLFTDRSWGDRVGLLSAAIALVAGSLGLILLVIGRDPFATGRAASASLDGLGIVGVFTMLYLVVGAALAAARTTRGRHAAAI
jgi:hypothetical protein